MQLLLEYKLDGNHEFNGRTAMQERGGQKIIGGLLLANNVMIDTLDKSSNWTALHAAGGGGHLDVVQFLLDNEAGDNAGASASEGVTDMQAAAGGGQHDMVQLL